MSLLKTLKPQTEDLLKTLNIDNQNSKIMNTNFFNQIDQLGLTGILHITISKGAADNLIVSTWLNNEQCGDKAKNLITPLNLRGTASELDEEYFDRISTPMQATSGLMTNMEDYLKQVEEAKKQSAMVKEKSEKEKKDKQDKDKKYTEAMQKVADLEKAGKYKEAYSKLPDPAQYPEHEEAISKRKSAISAKLDDGFFSGFGLQPQTETEEDQEENYPDGSAEEEEEEESWEDNPYQN